MEIVYTFGEEQTTEFATEFAKKLKAGSFISLVGDLGAGKTAFTKGIAKGLNVKESVISPTYTLLRAYESGNLPLYHFDVYRIGDVLELEEIGYYDYCSADGVCVCEWANLIEEELPKDKIEIKIERVDELQRKITVSEL